MVSFHILLLELSYDNIPIVVNILHPNVVPISSMPISRSLSIDYIHEIYPVFSQIQRPIHRAEFSNLFLLYLVIPVKSLYFVFILSSFCFLLKEDTDNLFRVSSVIGGLFFPFLASDILFLVSSVNGFLFIPILYEDILFRVSSEFIFPFSDSLIFIFFSSEQGPLPSPPK